MAKTATKKWYQSRTIQIGIVTALSGLVTLFATEYSHLGMLVTVKGVLDIMLRFLTTTEIE